MWSGQDKVWMHYLNDIIAADVASAVFLSSYMRHALRGRMLSSYHEVQTCSGISCTAPPRRCAVQWQAGPICPLYSSSERTKAYLFSTISIVKPPFWVALSILDASYLLVQGFGFSNPNTLLCNQTVSYKPLG